MSIAKIECSEQAEAVAWDAEAKRLSGNFFHCYAFAKYESTRPGTSPLFIRAFDAQGACVAVGIGILSRPGRWPFSRYAAKLVLPALPATLGGDGQMQSKILALLEIELVRLGVFQLDCDAFASPLSAQVLTPASYRLSQRVEFHIDLAPTEQIVWESFSATRRNDIRKAEKSGLTTRPERDDEAIRRLLQFQGEALNRRGVSLAENPNQVAEISELLGTGHALLLTSYLNEKPVNAALFGHFGGQGYYLNSGSSLEGNKVAGPSHLLWTAMRFLQGKGCVGFNLGGVSMAPTESKGSEGLIRFKKQFGAVMIDQPAGEKVISRLGEALNSLANQLRRAI